MIWKNILPKSYPLESAIILEKLALRRSKKREKVSIFASYFKKIKVFIA